MACIQNQQLVAFAKARVKKDWFRYFNNHKDFRNDGSLHLFSLMALYSYANFRSNKRHIDNAWHMEAPGQWICKISALPRILRVHSKAEAMARISQKIDSFMSGLGINVGNTGSSMLTEMLLAGRGVGAAASVFGGAVGGAVNNAASTAYNSSKAFTGGGNSVISIAKALLKY